MKKSDIILTSSGLINYDLVKLGQDPFAVLSSLKSGDLVPRDDFDPELAKSGGLLKPSGNFDIDMIAEEFNIANMVRSVLDENALVPKDIKIDDGDFPLAKNVYDWVSRDSFAGTVITPFLEQLIWGVVLFGEYCARCSDLEYLFHSHKVDDTVPQFLRKVQLLEHGVCPACKARKSEMVLSEEMTFYQELAVQAGQRSGKTACVGGILTPYMTHRVLKMQKPCNVFGIASSTMLHGTFCALTYAQAKETLWEFYYGTLMTSEWFKNYNSMLRYYEGKYGQSLLKLNDTFVVYRPRSLMWYPAGPDKRVLRGRTRVFGGIDEIGYFDNDAASNKVKTSAHHVYDALDASLLTVRGAANRLLKSGYDNILTGYSMNVSSPVSQRDKICTLVRQARGSKTMYGIHRPTWEVNPDFPRNSTVIVDAYTRNPADAERNYGANPPLSANPYLSNITYIAQAFRGKSNPIKLKTVVKNRKQTGQANKWARIEKIKRGTKPSMLTIDAGVSFNSFSITVLHIDEKTGEFVAQLMCEIIPEPGIPLNYTQIYDNVISPIITARNVKVVLADRWNSIKILSDIEAEFPGVTAEQYSLKYKDIGITKSHLEAGTLVLPKRETKSEFHELLEFDNEIYPNCFAGRPVDHLAMQMQTVQDTTLQVIKGDGLTDDTWRALALGVYGLSTDKYAELLIGAAPEQKSSGLMAVSRLASGGGGGIGFGGNSGSMSHNSSIGVMVRNAR